MRKVWVIAQHEYKVTVRRTGFILMTTLIPILGAVGLLVAALFSGQAADFFERTFATEPRNIGVVDHTGAFTPILPEYQARFRLFPDEQAGRAAVQADEITNLLVIPQDYLATGRVLVIGKGSDFTVAALQDSRIIRAFFTDHLLRDQVGPTLRKRVSDPFNPVWIPLTGGQKPHEGPLDFAVSFMIPYFLGILLIITVFTSSGYLLRGVSQEKTTRVIEIVLSSVSAQELLMGKVIGLGAAGLTQVVVWLLSAAGLSGGALGILGLAVPLLNRPEVFVLGLVYYILGFAVYAVLMGAAGALGTTMQESQQLAGILSFIAAIPMMVSGFMFSNPNAAVVRVLSWFPLTASTMMLIRLPMASVPPVDVVGSIVVLVLTIPAVLWVGGKVFRVGLLMYGKRPSLKQLARALREA
ncbi:MAG: ABC transporter permease [Anaerolineae bacterium]|nr:ABC transporter permease [Anaerolineae bacterium]